MSEAIGEMAVALSTGSQDSSESEQSRLSKAVKLLGKDERLTVKEKAKLMLIAQQDIGFADLILSVEDEETRCAIYELKLEA
jgi:hypothetical protein